MSVKKKEAKGIKAIDKKPEKPFVKKDKKAMFKKKPENKPVVADIPEEAPKKNNKGFQSLRGMRDIVPKDGHYWVHAYNTAQAIANAYCYDYVETPIVEQAQLFVKSIGKGTDVVDKEMYVFETADGEKVALRPEFTAGVVRSYISNGMLSLPQPVKMWSYGALFRHDRPQAGRYRQFHQFNCEVIGERDPVVDAELISVAYHFLTDLGLAAQVYINSIGSKNDRENYQVELLGYLRSKRALLCEDCKKRMTKNPLRVLDCKEPTCQELLEEAPQIIEWLSAESKDFFVHVLEYLDELSIPYVLQPTLVRGLDYYSDTVFELCLDGVDDGRQRALGGGGRYDALVEDLGGRENTPASGFALGIERVVMALQAKDHASVDGMTSDFFPSRKVFFAQLGAQARRRALYLIESLRTSHIEVGSSLAKSSLKAQLELADKLRASHTLILGQKEVQDGTVIVRDMNSGIQEIIDQKKLEQYVRKLLV